VTLRLLYHSDCDSFAGCEQMLVVLLHAAQAAEGVQALLTFRSSPDYEAGARARLPATAEMVGLRLPDASRVRAALRGRIDSPSMQTPLKALTYALPVRQAFQLWDIARLYRLFRRERPHLVHINNGGFPGAASCNAAAVSAALAGIPVVYVVNNIATGYRHPTRWADFPIDRLVTRCVDRFVTGSTAAAQALTAVLGLQPGKVSVVPNGIAVRLADQTAAETRRGLSVARDTRLLVTVARLEARKGHRYLLEAMSLLRRSDALEKTVLVLEGTGPEEHALRAQAKRLAISEHVRFVAREPNICNLIAAADVVIIPSVASEDFPNIVLEAMAFGKPVVASSLAGIPEQVLDGETGILVPPGNSAALAEAIASLESSERRAAMGAAGRSHFEEHFTAERAWKRYLELYSAVLSDHRGRRRSTKLLGRAVREQGSGRRRSASSSGPKAS